MSSGNWYFGIICQVDRYCCCYLGRYFLSVGYVFFIDFFIDSCCYMVLVNYCIDI